MPARQHEGAGGRGRCVAANNTNTNTSDSSNEGDYALSPLALGVEGSLFDSSSVQLRSSRVLLCSSLLLLNHSSTWHISDKVRNRDSWNVSRLFELINLCIRKATAIRSGDSNVTVYPILLFNFRSPPADLQASSSACYVFLSTSGK